MKVSFFFAILPILVHGVPAGIPPNNAQDVSSVLQESCSIMFNPACTMSMEQMFHVKLFYKRKEGTTPEEFSNYWANSHAALSRQFHIRHGVVKYSQYHSHPKLRNLGRAHGGFSVLDFDGAAEFWIPNLETFQSMGSDPEYLEKIHHDESNFIDPKSMKMIIGVDYIVVENQNAVIEHGRQFGLDSSSCNF